MPTASTPTASWGLVDDRVEISVASRPVVALMPSERTVRVGLVVPVLNRVVDVSVHPAAACMALEEAGRRQRVPASSVEATARRALLEAARRAGAWAPPAAMCLPRAFGGVAFPLLAAAYDDGAAPVREVPRWAEPILASPTVGAGAVVAFGSQATRPVRRALVEAIRPTPTGEVDLTVLALALMGRDVLQPDRLARVLRSDRVPHPPSDLPDPAVLRAARVVLRRWGDIRTERVLLDAAARADGVRLLVDVTRYAQQLGDHGPAHPLPNRLVELHDAHRLLMRTRPATPRLAGPPHRALPPRAGLAPVAASTPISSPPAIRALDGRAVGELTLVIPREVGDLARWGRVMSNCLADFGPSAAAGHSVIVGVRRANRLEYAVELTATGAIRQFCGRANRPPPDADRRAVVDALGVGGALPR